MDEQLHYEITTQHVRPICHRWDVLPAFYGSVPRLQLLVHRLRKLAQQSVYHQDERSLDCREQRDGTANPVCAEQSMGADAVWSDAECALELE